MLEYEHPSSDAQHTNASAANYASLEVPPGHLPLPGSCRIWFPGTPPGQQPPPGDCEALERNIPQGAWLLYRRADDPRHVDVSVYDDRRPGVIAEIRIFVAATGTFVGIRGESSR
ncbi:MAG: hypothetical protein ACYTFQ_28025 [Planctomycetota bacterium]